MFTQVTERLWEIDTRDLATYIYPMITYPMATWLAIFFGLVLSLNLTLVLSLNKTLRIRPKSDNAISENNT